MGAIEQGGKVATATIESLKSHPLALALVVINVLFLMAATYTLHELANSSERKDALLSQLTRACTAAPRP